MCHPSSNETHGEKKDGKTVRCLEQNPEAAPHITAAVWLFTSDLEKCWARLDK